MNIAQKIADRLERVRVERGWSQELMAEKSTVSQATISTVFKKKVIEKTGKPTTPTIGTVEAICDAVGIPLWVMVHDYDEVFDAALKMMSERQREALPDVYMATSRTAASMTGLAIESAKIDALARHLGASEDRSASAAEAKRRISELKATLPAAMPRGPAPTPSPQERRKSRSGGRPSGSGDQESS